MSHDDVFPDRDMSHRDKVEFMLEREGWALDAVPADISSDPPLPRYAYTIGFEDRFAFPELCLFGLSPVACRGLFGLVADALAGGTELPVGPPFIGLLDGGQPCALLPVDAPSSVGLFPALAEHHTLAGDRRRPSGWCSWPGPTPPAPSRGSRPSPPTWPRSSCLLGTPPA